MERRISSHRLAIGFRVVVRRLLIIWYWFLTYRANKWFPPMACCPPLELTSRRNFLLKNYEQQERLRQFFAPYYHLCNLECSCCRSEYIRYGKVDSILYGIYPEYFIKLCPVQSGAQMSKLIFIDHVFLLKRYFKKYVLEKKDQIPERENPQVEEGFCPDFTEKGCDLPWGMRPTFCVSLICGRFLRAMGWRDYWRYVRLNIRYLLLLTVSMASIVSEWQRQQRVYDFRTKEA